MTNHTNHRIVYLALLAVVFALAGCGKSSKDSPPKQQVQNTVAAVLPPFLSLVSIELEPISTGTESVKVNFKAIVASKEDLYQVDREVEGTPKVTLLKVVQAAGTKTSLYGSVGARRMIDKWTLQPTDLQVGSEQFGKPRGAFNTQSYPTGSDAANAALRQQAVNAELQEQAKRAALQQQERDSIASEEQRQKEAERQRKEEEQRRAEEKKKAARDRVETLERAALEAKQEAQVQAARFLGDPEAEVKGDPEAAEAELNRTMNELLRGSNDPKIRAPLEARRNRLIAEVAAKKARAQADQAKKLAEQARRDYDAIYNPIPQQTPAR
jgi:hypothetical protein